MAKGCFELQVLVSKILHFKEKHNLTYQKMANILEVDKSYVHKVVNLKTYPSFPILRKLSEMMETPLCLLFLPSEEEIRGEVAQLIRDRLDDLEWSVEQLQAQTKIPHLRLLDIVQGTAAISNEEEKLIARVLDLTDNYNYREIKMRMLKSFLNGMDLEENQVENVLEYIQGQV